MKRGIRAMSKQYLTGGYCGALVPGCCYITQTESIDYTLQMENKNKQKNKKTPQYISYLSAMLPACTPLINTPASPPLAFFSATTLKPRPPTEGFSISIYSICRP